VDVEVAADVRELEQVRRRRWGVHLAQLRWRQRAGAPRVRRNPLRRPDRAHELLLPAHRRCADDLDGIAVRRDGGHPALVPLQHGDELRQVLHVWEPLERHDDGEAHGELAAPARVAGRLAAERRGDIADEGERPVQGHPAPRPGRADLCKTSLDPRGRLRPDPRHAAEPSFRGGLAQLGQRRDPECMAERAHSLGRDAEQRRDADKLRQRLCLQLVELGEPAGRDELAQTRLDSGPDPGQLLSPSLAHEGCHVGRRRADQIGRAAVRAHRVVARAVQVEQGGEGLETLGEGCVVHD
jgi:hypothetical protein